MSNFHDVVMFSGCKQATTASRLEIAAQSNLLHQIFSSLKDCDGCKEPRALIFPDEDEATLKQVFKRLSHFKSDSGVNTAEGKSFTSDPEKVNRLLAYLQSGSPQAVGGQSQSQSQSSEKLREVSSGLFQNYSDGDELADLSNLRESGGRQERDNKRDQEEVVVVKIGGIKRRATRSGGKRFLKDSNQNSKVGERKEEAEDKSEEIKEETEDKSEEVTEEAEDKSEEVTEEAEDKSEEPSLVCGLCPARLRFKCRSHLYQHYSLNHYHLELTPLVDDESDTCPLCPLVFRGRNRKRSIKIVHLGSVHREVEKFLPSHLVIQSKRGPRKVKKGLSCKRETEEHQQCRQEYFEYFEHDVDIKLN